MNEEEKQLRELSNKFPEARRKFEAQVEMACLEVTEVAKQISSAIGEVSVREAKDAIIKEFIKKLREPIHYGEFHSKVK